jgi:hypothetical protein
MSFFAGDWMVAETAGMQKKKRGRTIREEGGGRVRPPPSFFGKT